MAKRSKIQSTRGNPFRGFFDVMSEMNRAQEQWFRGSKTDAPDGGRSLAAAYVPPADIFAIDGDLVVRIEVPGVRREDVSLNVTGGMLTVSGHRESELDEAKVVYYTRERVYGAFRRTMMLPEGIEQSDINASFRNGLLEIRVKHAASARPQNVDIADNDDPED